MRLARLYKQNDIAEATRRKEFVMKFKSIFALLLAACMLLGVVSCSKQTPQTSGEDDTVLSAGPVVTDVPNVDGEIGGRGVSDGVDGTYTVDEAYDRIDSYHSAVTDVMATEAVEDWTMAPSEIWAEPEIAVRGDVIYGDDQTVYSAGTLTAGEWRDNSAWSDWLEKIGQDAWRGIADAWNVSIERRVEVTVSNGGVPIRGARVELMNAAGENIWSTVTDHEGKAYLFCMASEQARESDKPTSVRVSAVDCETVTVELGASDSLQVSLAAARREVKLDLMFVVDTTGSMADELKYLQAELEDVVERVGKESKVASIRTSVNFYRDEGDEYVVRYFGFRDDISESIANISAQHAEGGGDYPEAVHTALDNAINAHAWDSDSVKLLFLVLDAPPHQKQDVIASLSSSIEQAATLGIRIIPVMASGSDTTCEVLFRSMAILTGGTYAFLTNHSGVGNAHAEQSVGEYNVEKLNDLMVRVIKEYCS